MNSRSSFDCLEPKCLCHQACEIQNGCIFSHDLFDGIRISVRNNIRCTPPEHRHSKIIEILSAINPPKVSEREINYYFSQLRKGINLDIVYRRGRVTPKFLRKELRKDNNRIVRSFKKDHTRIVRDQKRVKSKMWLAHEKRREIEDALKKTEENDRQFLQNQTTEVFALAKKHGWIIAKMLSEPDQNFHEE